MRDQYPFSLLVLGASARAAAFSVLRAGIEPFCADLFGDIDLVERCEVTRVTASEYPQLLVPAARAAPPGPWLYVGAIENHPALVELLSAERLLWGNGATMLRRVRDPFEIAACLARAGLPHPAVQLSPEAVPADGSWLIKPRAVAGGRGIRVWRGELAADRSPITAHRSPACYFQRRIDGASVSAVFVADGRRATLLGVTRQLVGEAAFHAKPFHYCGSVGPIELPAPVRLNCEKIGGALAAEFELIGLFGVDGLLCDDAFWPVEVNPRYTASVEIIEHALGVPFIGLHRTACVRREIPDAKTQTAATRCVLGKAVLFAPRELTAPDLSELRRETIEWAGRWPVPRIADVPRAGTVFRAGSPVLTVFATADTSEACQLQLERGVETILRGFE